MAERQAGERRAAVNHSHALGLVPRSFDVVRSIFGERGPCVKPRAEVVAQLRQKCPFTCGLTSEEASHQVTLLTRLLPEWLKQEAVQGSHLLQLRTAQQLRINRGLAAGQLRAKLRVAVDAGLADVAGAADGGEAEGGGAVVVAGGKDGSRGPVVTGGVGGSGGGAVQGADPLDALLQ